MNKKQIQKCWKDPVSNLEDIIAWELQLMENRYVVAEDTGNMENAVAIAQEYAEWVSAEDGDRLDAVIINYISIV